MNIASTAETAFIALILRLVPLALASLGTVLVSVIGMIGTTHHHRAATRILEQIRAFTEVITTSYTPATVERSGAIRLPQGRSTCTHCRRQIR
jgi:hypothetical protein